MAEKTSLKNKIRELEGTVSDMERSLGDMKERERLMVEYPDLNGPVNADMTGTFLTRVLMKRCLEYKSKHYIPWKMCQHSECVSSDVIL